MQVHFAFDDDVSIDRAIELFRGRGCPTFGRVIQLEKDKKLRPKKMPPVPVELSIGRSEPLQCTGRSGCTCFILERERRHPPKRYFQAMLLEKLHASFVNSDRNTDKHRCYSFHKDPYSEYLMPQQPLSGYEKRLKSLLGV